MNNSHKYPTTALLNCSFCYYRLCALLSDLKRHISATQKENTDLSSHIYSLWLYDFSDNSIFMRPVCVSIGQHGGLAPHVAQYELFWCINVSNTCCWCQACVQFALSGARKD